MNPAEVARSAELHDRMMVGIRAGRLDLDELWQYVGKEQKRVTAQEGNAKGDQWNYIALSSSTRAIVSYWTGKRDSGNTHDSLPTCASA